MMEKMHSTSESSVENFEAQKTRVETIERQLGEARLDETIVSLENGVVAKDISALAAIYDSATANAKAILGAIVFAVASHGALTQTVQTVENPDSSFEAHQMLKEAMQKVSGVDVLSEASKVKRSATLMKADKETQLTIIHVGQVHKTLPEVNFRLRQQIIQSQKEVAQFLAATTTPATKVFAEGYTEKSMELVAEDKSALRSLENFSSFEELKLEYEKIWKKHPDIDVALLNKVTGDKLSKMGFVEVSPLTYTKGVDMLVLYPTGLFPAEKGYMEMNDNASIVTGATQILNIQGSIKVEPAETSEGNAKSKVLGERLKVKGKELGVLFKSFNASNTHYRYLAQESLPNIGSYSAKTIQEISQLDPCKKSVKCQEIAAQIIYEDIPAIKRAVLNDREDIAVALIAKAAQGEQKVFPLVYGSAHDFTAAVMRWNQKHPEMQFNLITVK